MPKTVQRARLVLADGTDLSNLVTEVNIPLDSRGLTEVTAKFVGVRISVDDETGLITITAPAP